MSSHSNKMFCKDGNQYFISNDQGRSWHNLHGTSLYAEANAAGITALSLDNKNFFPLRSCNNINSKNSLQDDIKKRIR